MAASLDDLKDAVKTTLESRGVLDSVRARMRAEIFNALEEDTGASKPELSNENLILNELFREYLEFNGYKHTLSVFMPETGQPKDRPFSRPFLAEQLHIPENETTRRVPLVYGILSELKTATSSAGGRAGGMGDAGMASESVGHTTATDLEDVGFRFSETSGTVGGGGSSGASGIALDVGDAAVPLHISNT